jgi:AbiV family abortive infection protein
MIPLDERFQSEASGMSQADGSPTRELIQAVQKLVEALVTPEEMVRILENANRTFEYKRVKERMLPFFNQLAELSSLRDPLGQGASDEEDVATFSNLTSHAENLWRDACLLFKAKRYAPSLFLAIVTLEEIGKIAVAKVQLFARHQARFRGEFKELKVLRRRDNPLYSHTHKHLLAACAGAVVNSRLDRVLGIDNVNRFLSDVETHKVEKLRQECLYAELQGRTLHLPYQSVTGDDSRFYLVIAGELLAEVSTFAGPDLLDFLTKVEQVEKDLGLIP